MCLVCLVLALVLWLIRLAGLPWFGEPGKRRLDALVQSEDTVQVRGQIQDYEIKDNSKAYLIKSCVLTIQEDEIPVKKLYLITQQETMLTIGSTVTTEGVLEQTETPANPGQFDAASWYAARGIYYTMWAEQIRPVRRAEPGMQEYMKRIRGKIAAGLSNMLPEDQAGILAAMLLGEKSLLTPETKSAYQTGGVLHVLSISGLHLTMLGAGLFRLLQRAGCGKWVSSVLAIAGMAGYTVFTGNGVATRRAFLMFTVMMIAGLIGRTYDTLSALALAAVITLTGQSENLSYSGFWLSYTAVLGTALVWPVWKKGGKQERKRTSVGKKKGEQKSRKTEEVIRRQAGGWKDNVMVCTAITLTMLPLTAYFFYEIPVFSLVPNLVILPTMPVVMGSGLIGACVGTVSAAAGKLLLLPASFLLELYERVTETVQKLPYSVWICGQPEMWQMVLYYLLMGCLLAAVRWSWQEGKEGKKAALFLNSKTGRGFCAGICVLSVFLLTCRWNPPLSITALDVGQGDAIVIRWNGRHTWLLDGGSTDEKNVGTYRILPYLKCQGIAVLEGVFVTHSDEDHVNGVRELLELSAERQTAVRIRRLFLPDWMKGGECAGELERLAEACGTDVRYVRKGDVVQGRGLRMEIFHPDGKDYRKEPNAGSIVISLKYGAFDALLTGDLEKEGEDRVCRLLEQQGYRYEYLKVAHHGSKNSTLQEFLEAVDPETGIISCSASGRYGHPHRELLERLKATGTDVYVTSDQGAIRCVTDGKNYEIRGYRGTLRREETGA